MLNFNSIIFFILSFISGLISAIIGIGPITIMILKVYYFIKQYCIKKQIEYAKYFALGASISESLYAGISLWGINNYLYNYIKIILKYNKLLLSVIIIILGISLSNFKLNKNIEKPRNLKSSFILGFSMNFINIGLFGIWSSISTIILSIGIKPNFKSILSFIIGSMLGIFLWYNILINLINKYRKKISNNTIIKYIHILGNILFIIGFIIFLIFIL